MLQCFVCSPIPKVREKKWSTGQSFNRKEITSYRIGTLAFHNFEFVVLLDLLLLSNTNVFGYKVTKPSSNNLGLFCIFHSRSPNIEFQLVCCMQQLTILFKSCGELSLLVKCSTCTFGSSQSCNFKQFKNY